MSKYRPRCKHCSATLFHDARYDRHGSSLCRVRVKGRWWHEPEQVFPAEEDEPSEEDEP